MAQRKPRVLKVDDDIVLRQYTIDDAPIIFQLIDSCREHLSQHGEDTAIKNPNVQSVRDSIANPENPKRRRLGIWDGGTFVGSINITPGANRIATIGYWVGQQYERKGYVTRVAYALIQSVFKAGKIDAVEAKTAKTNTRSNAVLVRLGFSVESEQGDDIIYRLPRWLPFYLDACSFHGLIVSRVRWEEVVRKYQGNIERLKGMRFNSQATKGCVPDFGEGAFYKVAPTLGQWAISNGIDLDIDAE